MISIKTPSEIALLRQGGKKLAQVKKVAYDAIKPGVSTWEIAQKVEKQIHKLGCKSNFKGYHGFPSAACVSINEEMIHGIPSKNKIIQKGDVVKVDVGLIFKSWHLDSAFTKGVEINSQSDQKLIKIAREAFEIGINQIKLGSRIGDISSAIGDFVKSQGYFVPTNFAGHGIGKELHEEPLILNYGFKGQGPLLKNGMVLAIEPMILQTSNEVKILKDGWTVVSVDKLNTSHYEQTIAIVDGFAEILTEGENSG